MYVLSDRSSAFGDAAKTHPQRVNPSKLYQEPLALSRAAEQQGEPGPERLTRHQNSC